MFLSGNPDRKEEVMLFPKKQWQEIPADSFVSGGEGWQFPLIDTRYIRVNQQKFWAGTRVQYHSHSQEWELVIRFGWGVCLGIYPPGTEHCLFGPQKSKGWWSIISIKIGKRS